MSINKYGDELVENDGKGADIASQRFDELDKRCLSMAEIAAMQSPVVVLDIGAGRCAMANALVQMNGVTAIAIEPGEYQSFAKEGVIFVNKSAEEFFSGGDVPEFNLLYSQRTIHYLPFRQAEEVLRAASVRIKTPGFLFLSASGMATELSKGYGAGEHPVQGRFGKLSSEMQEKHGIRQSVCLYTKEELSVLVENAGWSIVDVSVSEFGNVKLVAVANSHLDGGG